MKTTPDHKQLPNNAMQPIKIELSPAEAQTLVELLDLATKAGGLQAARHAVPLTDRIMQSVQTSQSTETDDSEA